eukprot:1138627-Pelagomonas_calceolata.AAC.3
MEQMETPLTCLFIRFIRCRHLQGGCTISYYGRAAVWQWRKEDAQEEPQKTALILLMSACSWDERACMSFWKFSLNLMSAV